MSWDNYVQEMSKQGTWCDNIIIQAEANALSCTITDSIPNAFDATITDCSSNFTPEAKKLFLWVIIMIYDYASTLQVLKIIFVKR